MGGLLQASTERLQGTAIPGPAPWTWRAGPAEPRCSSTEASVRTMRFAVGVAASALEIVEVACEARRGRFSARGRSPGAKLEIGVKGACVGDLPASHRLQRPPPQFSFALKKKARTRQLSSTCVLGDCLRGAGPSAISTSAEALLPPGPTALALPRLRFSLLSEERRAWSICSAAGPTVGLKKKFEHR